MMFNINGLVHGSVHRSRWVLQPVLALVIAAWFLSSGDAFGADVGPISVGAYSRTNCSEDGRTGTTVDLPAGDYTISYVDGAWTYYYGDHPDFPPWSTKCRVILSPGNYFDIGNGGDGPLYGGFRTYEQARDATLGTTRTFSLLEPTTIKVGVIDGDCFDNEWTVYWEIRGKTAPPEQNQAHANSPNPLECQNTPDAAKPNIPGSGPGASGQAEGQSASAQADPVHNKQGSPPNTDNASGHSCGMEQGAAANPIDLYSGNVSFENIDLGTPATQGSLALMKSYTPGSPATGALGANWTHSLERRLTDLGTEGAKEADGRGTERRFLPDGHGGYSAFAAGGIRLVRDAGMGWAVTYDTGTTYRYLPDGRLDYIQNVYGRKTQLTYAEDGLLSRLTGPSGQYLEFTHQNGRLSSARNQQGHEVQYAYNPAGLLAAVADSRGGLTAFQYSGSGTLTRIAYPTGEATEYTYVSSVSPRVKFITTFASNGLQSTSELQYPSANARVFIDPLGRSTRYEYDASKRLVKTIAPGNRETVLTRDAVGRLTSETDPEGRVTTWSYNADGSLASTTTPGGRVTRVERDPLTGFPTRTILPDGSVILKTFDTQGNLSSVTDPLGRVTSYIRDLRGLITSVIDPVGRITTFTYDEHEMLVSQQNAAGQLTTHQRDTISRLIASTTPGGRVTQVEYLGGGDLVKARIQADGRRTDYEMDGLGRVTASVRANGARTEFTYARINGLERVIRITDALGGVSQLEYDLSGDLVVTTDPASRVTRFIRDEATRITSMTLPNGGITSRVYSPTGDVTATTNARGATTRYFYNEEHELVRTEYPDGSSTSATYDARGRPVSQTNAVGGTTRLGWDSASQLIATTSAEGLVTRFTYSDTGTISEIVNPAGHRTGMSYDSLDRLTSTTDALGFVSRREYHPDGELHRAINARSAATVTTYDAIGRPTRIEDPLGHHVDLAYNAVGDITTITNENGAVHEYTYDLMSRRISEKDPNGKIATYAYNAVGERMGVTFPDGSSWTYTRDVMGRITSRQLLRADASIEDTETFTYDLVGNLLSSENNAVRVESVYDIMDREASRTVIYKATQARRVLQFVYDAMGRRQQLTDTHGRVVTYEYDRDSRPTRLIIIEPASLAKGLPSGLVTRRYDFTWDAASNLVRVDRPNGTRTRQVFDPVKRLINITHERVSPTATVVLGSQTLTRDAVGNTTQILTDRGESFQYTYDLRDQLTRAQIPAALLPPPPATPDEEYDEGRLTASDILYQYDAAGNRTQETHGAFTVSATFSPANELLFRKGITFRYDVRGNQIEKTYPSGRRHTRAFDVAGRLTSFTNALGVQQRYAYDTANRRVTLEDVPQAKTTHFLWEAGDILDQWSPDRRSNEDGLLLVPNIGGQQLEQTRYARTSRGTAPAASKDLKDIDPDPDRSTTARNAAHLRFLYQDQISSTSFIANAAGSLVDRYVHGPFGEDLAGGLTARTPISYAGTQRVQPPRLSYMWNRWYDPASGRFLSRDPISFSGGDFNLYRYVKNNPINRVDPLGLFEVPLPGGYTFDVNGFIDSFNVMGYQTTTFAVIGAAAGGAGGGMAGGPVGAAALGFAGAVTGGALGFASSLIQIAKNPPFIHQASSTQCTKDGGQGSGGGLGDKAPRPDIKTSLDPRVTQELNPGETRTPAENAQARNFYKRNIDEGRKWWEQRLGKKWPKNPDTGAPQWAEHPTPLKDGGDPLFIEPGVGPDPNAPHMRIGPDGLTDHQRWGAMGGRPPKIK